MAPKNPRIHAVLEPPIYRAVERLARRAGVSLSQQVRNLVGDALEFLEDAGLDAFAESRRRTFVRARALSVEGLRKAVKRLRG